MIRWYFAYGSNMNPARVHLRGLAFDRLRHGWLDDYSLCFNKVAGGSTGAGHANLLVQAGARAEGVLYRLCPPDAIERMDPFERVPINYTRQALAVSTADGAVTAWTYIATAAASRAPGVLRPTAGYLAHLLAGASFLSPDYAAVLHTQPLYDADHG